MSKPTDRPGMLCAATVRQRFERAAATFDDADFVHRHAARGLFERMAPVLVDAKRILDAGSGTGRDSRTLARHFRRSHVVSLDASTNMLRRARRGRSRFARISELCADARELPLQTGSIDLVYANLLLPWIDDLPRFFAGVTRILKKDGLFVFATLGPDSLDRLREAWRAVDGGEHVHLFPDMHDVGDALVQSGLRDPVLDVDYLTVSYRSADSLFADLTRTGARNSLHGRPRALTGKRRFAAVKEALAATDSAPLPIRLELVFGHAWGGGPRLPPGEVRLDVSDIGRRRRDE